MRRLPTIQKCDFPAVHLRHFFGWGGRRLFYFFLLFSTSLVAQNGVTITSAASNPTQQNPVPLNFEFDQPVNHFELQDVNITGGSLSDFFVFWPEFKYTDDPKRLRDFELGLDFTDLEATDFTPSKDAVIAIDFDQHQNVYALTLGNGVFKYDSEGKAYPTNPIIKSNKFSEPRDIAIDENGIIYVADAGHNAIFTFNSTDGSALGDLGEGSLNSPSGLAIGNNQTIYVADTGKNRVVIFDAIGSQVGEIDKSGSPVQEQMVNPVRIAVDQFLNVYVSSTGNNRIQIYNSSGEYKDSILGGTSRLNSPGSLVVDDYGFLYVADFAGIDLNTFLELQDIAAEDIAQLVLNIEKLRIQVFRTEDLDAAPRTISTGINIPVDLALKPCGYLAVNNGDAKIGEPRIISLYPFKTETPLTFLFDLKLYEILPDTFTADLTIGEECEAATISVPPGVGVNKDCEPVPAESGEFSIVWDQTDPIVDCPTETTIISADSDQLYRIPDLKDFVTDNCDAEVEIIQNPSPNTTVTTSGSITLTATDPAGNTVSCSIPYELEEEPEVPAFTCLPSYTLQLDEDGATILNPEDLIEGDASGVTFDLDRDEFDCSDIGEEYTVTLSYSGAATGSCEITIEVEDKISPQAVCIGHINVRLAPGESRTFEAVELDSGSYDACSEFNLTYSLSKYTFTEADEGSNSIVFTAIDQYGNKDECTVNVQVIVEEVEDLENPVFTYCPDDMSLEADAGECGAVVNYTIPEATDNSGEDPEVLWIRGPRPGDFVPVGQPLTVVYRATDAANNSEECSFTITVEDTEAPVFTTCIGNEVHQIYEEDGQYIVPDYRDDVVATDNCSNNITYTQSVEPGATITTGTYIHIFAYDEFGNESNSCSFEVELIAAEEAVFENCPSNIVMDNDPGHCGAEVSFDTPIAMEGESTLSVYQIEGPASGSLFPAGTTTVTFEAIDSNDEPIQCSFTITVNDEESPVVNCPEDMFLTLYPGETERVVHFSTLPATDNCGTSVIQTDGLPSGSEFPPGTHFIEFTVTDPSGNENTCSFEIIVNPAEEPAPLEITCPEDQVLDLEEECSIALPDYRHLASASEGASITQSPQAGTMVSENTPVTLTATLDGEVETCSFDVQLTNFPEMIIYCLEDHTVEPNEDGNFVLEDYIRLVNTDGACGDINYTQDPAPGTSVSEDTKITITATDENGNFDDCSFTVRLEEPDPGTIACNDVGLFLDSNGLATLTGEDMYGGDSDDPAIESITAEKEIFTCDDLGPQTVTLTVTFKDGSSQTCDAEVTVVDDQLPEVYCVPPGKEFTLINGTVTIDREEILADVDDNCGVIDYWLEEDTFTSEGTKSITLFAEDASGNINSCTTSINVVQSTTTPGTCKPAIVYLDAFGNATLEAEEVFDGDPDDASIESMEVDRENFSCADVNESVQVSLRVNYTDGSSTTCTASVTVKDNIDPEAICVEEFTLHLNEFGVGMITPEIISRGSSDNCGYVMSLSRQTFGIEDVGEQEITLTVTDASGNTNTCTTTITVEPYDEETPGLTCVESLTLPLNENGEFRLQLNYTGEDENEDYELSKEFFTCEDIGTQKITVTYWGEYTGTCEIDITIVDETPPVVNCLSEIDIRLNAAGNAIISREDLGIEYSDNCGMQDTSLSREEFTTADIGTQEVVFTATDNYGNVSTCNISVNVMPYDDGETDPLECVDLHVLELGENGRAVLNPRDLFTGGSGSVQFTVSKDSFSCSDLGENTVTFNYTTPTEEGSCEVTIIVEDPLGSCEDPTDPEPAEYIILYPNPGNGQVQFQTSPGLEILRVEVFDMRGRFLFEKTYDSNTIFDKKLDLREFQSGVYPILIFTNSREFLKRAIIRN